MKTLRLFFLSLVAIGIIASGCKNMNKTQKGAAIGAGGGAVLGGVVGRALGNTAAGVIVGAAVGGTAGAVIGRKMDKQAEEMKQVMGDAEVKRVGEGIVIEFKDKVLFGYDQSHLSAQAQGSLNKLANVLKKYPDTNIEILGHTDARGTADYNQGLSQRRANSAAAYLRANGMTSSRITTKGLGESDPKATNETDEGRTENRRVEFVITANQKMIDDAKKEAGQ